MVLVVTADLLRIVPNADSTVSQILCTQISPTINDDDDDNDNEN
jgi:hypothetical protein